MNTPPGTPVLVGMDSEEAKGTAVSPSLLPVDDGHRTVHLPEAASKKEEVVEPNISGRNVTLLSSELPLTPPTSMRTPAMEIEAAPPVSMQSSNPTDASLSMAAKKLVGTAEKLSRSETAESTAESIANSPAMANETDFTAALSWDEVALPAFSRTFVESAWTSLGMGSDRTLRAAKVMLRDGLSYLNDEITISDSEQGHEVITERVSNFLDVPWAIEKLMLFGLSVCLDSFLYTTAILPLRFVIAVYVLGSNIWTKYKTGDTNMSDIVNLSQTRDLLKGLLIILVCIALQTVDAAQIYHSIRGQAFIKLYVIFNVLEIFDRLCCAFGGDILDSLFARSTLCRPSSEPLSTRLIQPIKLFLLAFVYILAHTIVLFYQCVALNVATNSYSNALLTLLVSNQFIEIKSSVFKRFEKENLFQLSCADIVERFQLMVFLAIITVRNLVELASSPQSTFSVLPTYWIPLFPFMNELETMITPVVIVLASELIVDWLKHAFITKFNSIRPSVYSKFTDILCRDLVCGYPSVTDKGSKTSSKQPTVDQSSVLSRRIGFAVLPLTCLMIRMILQTYRMIMDLSSDMTDVVNAPKLITVSHSWIARSFLTIFIFALTLLLKAVVGVKLQDYAKRRYGSMKERASDEQLLQEDADKEAKRIRAEFFDDPEDNVFGNKKPSYTLDNVDRYTLVRSRIP